MSPNQTGGCHCGKVRYSVGGQPELTFFCHCSDCQKTSGSPFSVELMLADTSIELDGDVVTYTVKGDSGGDVHRHHCARCGSGIYLKCDSDPGYVFLKAGTLDDANSVSPEMHIFTSSKQPWVKIDDGLPEFERMPPVE